MVYDVVIIGSGPAGATAAALLARQHRRVALLKGGSLSGGMVHTTWLNAKAEPVLREVGVDPRTASDAPITEVTFFDADLQKSRRPKLNGVPGYVVDRQALERTLAEAAVSRGAGLRSDWEVAAVRLREDGIELTSDQGESLCGRMMLVADGLRGPLVERLLPAARNRPAGRWHARVERAVDKDKAARKGGSLSLVLGLDREGAFGVVLARPGRLAVTVSVAGETGEAAPELLAALCQHLAAKKLVPTDMSIDAQSALVGHVPANVALEMESHVAKHTLLIGDAGGFVAAGSDEDLYPAMWSAQIATETVQEALASPHSQDALMEFNSRWRMGMGEYLRAPNTDMQFLIPLIFSNQPMADRLAAAFFAGQNI